MRGRHVRGGLVALVCAASTLLVVGCGAVVGTSGTSGTSSGAASNGATGTASAARVTATTGTPATATPAAGAASTSAAGSGGQVTVTTDQQHYKVGATLSVTLRNGLAQTIWTADHQTSCTPVVAEVQQNGQWQAVDLCKLMTPTRLIPLAAGTTTVERIATNGWAAGTYRVTLRYTVGDQSASGPSGTASSAQFTIG